MTIEELSAANAECPFMIDGYHIPSPSLGVWLYEWERVSRSYNNSNADFIDTTIAQKDKFNWKFDAITLRELRPLEAYIKNKISILQGRFFQDGLRKNVIFSDVQLLDCPMLVHQTFHLAYKL